jgi:hypothetical protein
MGTYELEGELFFGFYIGLPDPYLSVYFVIMILGPFAEVCEKIEKDPSQYLHPS